MKKAYLLLVVLLCVLGAGCSKGNENTVVIYATIEDYIVDYFSEQLSEKFPDYTILIENYSTGEAAAKLSAEGVHTACDIVWGLDCDYLEQLQENFVDLSQYDDSMYLPEMKIASHKYRVAHRYSGCVAVNTDVLKKYGLQKPASYNDLLDPSYKELIEMPNPKSSGTGYLFLKAMVNAWGEEEAFSYIDKLTENILQYTSSGAATIEALSQMEIAVCFGMTNQAVVEINQGVPIEIIELDVGAPYSTCGSAIIAGKETRKAVSDVYGYFCDQLVYDEKEKFLPEQVFVDQDVSIPNYPHNIYYADMTGNNVAEKERLLAKWMY